MEKKLYNVLWIDDQHDDMSGFIGDAKLNDILLVPFKSLNKGISEIKKNYTIYDGVLLDAKFFEDEVDTKGSEDTEFVHRAKEQLIQLPKKFEIFVFTAQAEAFDDKTFNKAFKKVYRKGIDEDVERLFLDIKSAADQMPDTQIRHEFSRVFQVCSEKYIGSESKKHLLQILASIKNPNDVFHDELYFTQIRIILESMFRKANKIGFLHDKCINEKGEVNLTESSRFLSGLPTKHLNVNCEISHFPKLIADAVHSILLITGAASHTTDPEIQKNIDLLTYRKTIQTPYLLYSLTFKIVDVLLWFKEYVDLNPNIEDNKKSWINIEPIIHNGDWITGTIINITDKGFGSFKPDSNNTTIGIPPKIMADNSLKENDRVKVTRKKDETGTKTHIDLIVKI